LLGSVGVKLSVPTACEPEGVSRRVASLLPTVTRRSAAMKTDE
jgi:hypothetical protein